MKAIKLLVLGIVMAVVGTAEGQINVNVQIGAAPAWGPQGYDNARYYYLPDVDAYYDRNTSMFIYISGSHWIRRSYLPSRYQNYNLYRGRKVVMNNYHGNSPYYNHKVYKTKYYRGYQSVPQHKMVKRNNKQIVVKYKEKRDDRDNRDYGRKNDDRDDRNYIRKNDNKNDRNSDHNGNGNGKGNGNGNNKGNKNK